VREDAKQVAKVDLGIEAMEARGGDEGQEVAGGLAVVVAADEEPGLAADGDTAQLALAAVVVEAKSAIVVETGQRTTLAVGVAQGSAQETSLVADLVVLILDPREERISVRAEVQLAEGLDLGGGLAPPGPVEREDPRDACEALARDDILGDRGLPDLAPGVTLIWSTT
jgi:hypothetical protein